MCARNQRADVSVCITVIDVGRASQARDTNTSVLTFDPSEARAARAPVAIYSATQMTKSQHGPLQKMRVSRSSGCVVILAVWILWKGVSTIAKPMRKWRVSR